MIHALSAALSVWGSRPQLPGSVPYARKYAVSVGGAPGTVILMQAGSLPPNWAASFCTERVCAPGRLTVRIPASGRYATEFQVVPDDRTAAKTVLVVVTVSAGGTTVRVHRISRQSDTGKRGITR